MPPDLPGLHDVYARSDPMAWAALAALMGAAYLAAWSVTWLGLGAAFIPWARSSGRHWTERARWSWPGRRLAPMTWILVPVPLMLPILLPSPSPFDPDERFGALLPPAVGRVAFLALGLLGVLRARVAWERRVNPAAAITPETRRAKWIYTFMVLGFWIWLPHALLARVLIRSPGLELTIVGGGWLLVLAYQLGGWIVLLRWTGLLRPAPDRLSAIAASVSRRMEIRLRSVELLALSQANAMAYTLTGRIFVTDAAMAVLGDDELTVTCAHELAHLSEPRRIAAARLLSALGRPLILGLLLFSTGGVDRFFEFETGLAIYSVVAALWICAAYFLIRLHHRMEIRADAMARAIEPDAGIYARALEKLYEANATPMVLSTGRGSHPELYDRLAACGQPPDYPRPAPPSAWPFCIGLLVLLVGAITGGIGLLALADAIE